VDLPTGARSAGVRRSTGAARSARRSSDLTGALAPQAFDDLPAPLAPQAFDDLPAPLAPQAFDDLPAPLAPQAFDDLPVAAFPRSSARSISISTSISISICRRPVASSIRARALRCRPNELDLPTVGGPRRYGIDLPAVSCRAPSPAPDSAGLPSPVAPRVAGLPAVPAQGFGDVELPSLAAASLPEVSRSGLPSAGSVQLPSLSARAPSGGFELDDGLPLVGGNLPALAGWGCPLRA